MLTESALGGTGRRPWKVTGSDLHVPRSWEGVTPGWMTRALSKSFPGAVVDRVDLGEIDVGTTSRAIATLSYSSGAGPESVFIKAQGSVDHRLVLASLFSLRKESWLFASGEELPLEVPAAYAVGVLSRRLDCVLVMEDVTARGGVPNISTDPLNAAQVRDGLVGLARLHARHWDEPLPAELQFIRPWRVSPAWAGFFGGGITSGVLRLRRSGDAGLLPQGLDSAAKAVRGFAKWARAARHGPQVLLHGDAHVGNTYALRGDRIGWYDWQLTRRGSWAHDVGYFMVSALSVDDRRTHERELLHAYVDKVNAERPWALTLEQAWAAYSATPPYGLGIFLQTLGLGGYQSDEVSRVCIERFGRAGQDLGSAAALTRMANP
jgi:hypothetical protein